MMIVSCSDSALVNVVDARPEDYASVASSLPADRLQMCFFTSGREALRSNAAAPNVWIVNLRLPDMASADLLEMLRWRYPGTPIVIVNDQYDAGCEIVARAAAPDMYLCKPLEADWLLRPFMDS